MFWMRNKENNFPIRTLIWRPDYISENQASMLVSTTDSNPNKKRKLEIEKSEPAEYTKLQGANGDNVQDGDNVQEVIVYVTQSDNETHTEDTKIDVSSSGR